MEFFLQSIIKEDVDERLNLESVLENNVLSTLECSMLIDINVEMRILEFLNLQNLKFLTHLLEPNKNLIGFYNNVCWMPTNS